MDSDLEEWMAAAAMAESLSDQYGKVNRLIMDCSGTVRYTSLILPRNLFV